MEKKRYALLSDNRRTRNSTSTCMRRIGASTMSLAWVLMLASLTVASAVAAQATNPVTAEEAHAIGVDAYLYLYPLVTMDVTRKQFTNVEPGKEFGKGPMNMFVNVPAYPPADLKVVVRANFDTLYSLAWLDLTKEPLVISAPDTDGRYYMLPMLDMWTDVLRRRARGRLATRRVIFSSPHRAGRNGSAGIHAPCGADPLCLGHRPHQDGWPSRLRCCA